MLLERILFVTYSVRNVSWLPMYDQNTDYAPALSSTFTIILLHTITTFWFHLEDVTCCKVNIPSRCIQSTDSYFSRDSKIHQAPNIRLWEPRRLRSIRGIGPMGYLWGCRGWRCRSRLWWWGTQRISCPGEVGSLRRWSRGIWNTRSILQLGLLVYGALWNLMFGKERHFATLNTENSSL